VEVKSSGGQSSSNDCLLNNFRETIKRFLNGRMHFLVAQTGFGKIPYGFGNQYSEY
jgi:hypothetical protein